MTFRYYDNVLSFFYQCAFYNFPKLKQLSNTLLIVSPVFVKSIKNFFDWIVLLYLVSFFTGKKS